MGLSYKLANTFIESVTNKHGENIALIFIYGSYARGTASTSSDIDLAYVTEDVETAERLYTSFVYNGVGYEFWPINWERLERISKAEEHWPVAASLLIHSKILWSRSKKDVERFNLLVERVGDFTKPEKRVEMLDRAFDSFSNVLNDLCRMNLDNTLTGTRFLAIRIIIGCFECLGYANQTYFSSGWGSNYNEVLNLRNRPEQLDEYLNTILSSSNRGEMIEASGALTQDTRNILRRLQIELAKPGEASEIFKNYYPGVREYVNKILEAERNGNRIKAVLSAYSIQAELMQMIYNSKNGTSNIDFNLPCEIIQDYEEKKFPDLLSANVNLTNAANQLDIATRDLFNAHKINLNEVEGIEEFKKILENK